MDPVHYPWAIDASGGTWMEYTYRHAVQILHPCYQDSDESAVRWSTIADKLSVALRPGIEFRSFYAADRSRTLLPELFSQHPCQGSLPTELIGDVLRILHANEMWGLMWEGGEHPLTTPGGVRVTRVRSQESEELYVAVRTTATDDNEAYEVVDTLTPSVWWPHDRSWCFATGIDSEYSLLACNDDVLLHAILADETLETLRLR